MRALPALLVAACLAALAVPCAAQSAGPPAAALAPEESHDQCPSCHLGHGSGRETTLLKAATTDALCLGCHGTGSGVQAPPGTPRMGLPPKAAASEHLWESAGRWGRLGRGRAGRVFAGGCVQCHSVHRRDWSAAGPTRTLRKEAFGTDGQPLPGDPSSASQLCFKCHGGGSAADTVGMRTGRVGILFSEGAASSHRMGSRGRASSPSLRWGAGTESLDCTSCHGGSPEVGLAGPHASRYPSLLSAPYETRPNVPESELAYALCYACHDRLSLLGNESFRLHREHITGHFAPVPDALREAREAAAGLPPRGAASGAATALQTRALGQRSSSGTSYQPASCATCHDPHGSLENRALLRFDRFLVSDNSLGQLSFTSLGPGRGECSLSCHGYDHVESRY